jgi:bile acid:Na+ symporter, BASS family
MDEFLRQSVPLVIAIFLVTAMLSLGLEMTIKQVSQPLRNRWLVIKSLLVTVVAVPLVAIVLSRVIPMEQALATGLVLYALAAGTEGGPKFVQMVKGNTPFASGLLAVLLTVTVIFLPMVINVAIPGAQVSLGEVVVKLLLLVALPICLGMLVNARLTDLAERISPAIHRLSMILLAVAFTLIIYVNLEAILSLQPTALLAGLLLFVISYGVGYAAGGPAAENRKALAIMTFARNGSISMLIAGQVFSEEPQVLVMVTLMAAGSVVVAVLVVVVDRLLNRQRGVTTAI